jgi:hypothetical protein
MRTAIWIGMVAILLIPAASAHPQNEPECAGIEAGPACTDTVWTCFFAYPCKLGGMPDQVPYLCLNPTGCQSYHPAPEPQGNAHGHEKGKGHQKNGH